MIFFASIIINHLIAIGVAIKVPIAIIIIGQLKLGSDARSISHVNNIGDSRKSDAHSRMLVTWWPTTVTE